MTTPSSSGSTLKVKAKKAMMAAIATVIRNQRGPGRPVAPGITCLSLSRRSGCSGGRPSLLPPPLLKGMILFFRSVSYRRGGCLIVEGGHEANIDFFGRGAHIWRESAKSKDY